MSYDEALMLGAPTVPTYTVGPSLSPEEYRARLVGVIEDVRADPKNVAWRKEQGMAVSWA